MRLMPLVAFLCLFLTVTGCITTGLTGSKQEILEAYSEGQSYLKCTPGCVLTDMEENPDVPHWCSKWRMDTETQKYYCVEIELSKLSQAEAPYAPIRVWGDEGAEGTYRVDCRPGCDLPTSLFGCKRPAKKAPYLETCANVANACGTGQSQIWFSGPTPAAPKNEPPPACVAFKSEHGLIED